MGVVHLMAVARSTGVLSVGSVWMDRDIRPITPRCFLPFKTHYRPIRLTLMVTEEFLNWNYLNSNGLELKSIWSIDRDR